MYSIGYRERNRIAQELAYDAHIDADKDLLRRYAPKSSLLVRTLISTNGSTLSYDIIYTLLQYCTREEILEHRQTFGHSSGHVSGNFLGNAKPPKKKLTKKEEYPKIDWRDLEDPSVQKAELIYSDRINLHRDLLRLDRELDGAPTPEKIAELVEKSIRSRLCFDELRSFNSTGRFLGRHPFVRADDGMSRLRQLLLTSPEDFMKEYRRAAMNVSRYGTRLRRDGLSEELQEKYRQLLDKWTEREKMMGECLKMNLYATEKRI